MPFLSPNQQRQSTEGHLSIFHNVDIRHAATAAAPSLYDVVVSMMYSTCHTAAAAAAAAAVASERVRRSGPITCGSRAVLELLFQVGGVA